MQGKPGKRKRHKASILQKKDGRCYLCMKLHGDDRIHLRTEEHHIFFGTGQRWKSEEDGMKVHLCPEHHRTGRDAVHNNARICRMVQKDAQRKYEETHTREQFRKRYGKSYIVADVDEFWDQLGERISREEEMNRT